MPPLSVEVVVMGDPSHGRQRTDEYREQIGFRCLAYRRVLEHLDVLEGGGYMNLSLGEYFDEILEALEGLPEGVAMSQLINRIKFMAV